MITVLDKGFIGVVAVLGSDLSAVNAARVSMGKQKQELDESDIKLMRYLANNAHTSPFRHAYVSFHIKAPDTVARQWYEHTVGATTTESYKDTGWNEISGRYVEYQDFTTPEFRVASPSIKQGSVDEVHAENESLQQEWNAMLGTITTFYEHLLERGVPKEQARMILPFATYTEWCWTASFQAIAHFCNLRLDSHAQKEIRVYAEHIDEIMQELFPNAWGIRHLL